MKLTKLGYLIAKFKQKYISHNAEPISDFYRKGGATIGKNTIICDYIPISEPELVEVKDDCIVSSGISFITHDHCINKVTNKGSNLFGKIVIGNNCFLGQRSLIMYGVQLADNIIVGSGSVVTKSFSESNIIIAGNPAKKIGTWDKFRAKYEDKAAFRSELADIICGKTNKMIRR